MLTHTSKQELFVLFFVFFYSIVLWAVIFSNIFTWSQCQAFCAERQKQHIVLGVYCKIFNSSLLICFFGIFSNIFRRKYVLLFCGCTAFFSCTCICFFYRQLIFTTASVGTQLNTVEAFKCCLLHEWVVSSCVSFAERKLCGAYSFYYASFDIINCSAVCDLRYQFFKTEYGCYKISNEKISKLKQIL